MVKAENLRSMALSYALILVLLVSVGCSSSPWSDPYDPYPSDDEFHGYGLAIDTISADFGTLQVSCTDIFPQIRQKEDFLFLASIVLYPSLPLSDDGVVLTEPFEGLTSVYVASEWSGGASDVRDPSRELEYTSKEVLEKGEKVLLDGNWTFFKNLKNHKGLTLIFSKDGIEPFMNASFDIRGFRSDYKGISEFCPDEINDLVIER